MDRGVAQEGVRERWVSLEREEEEGKGVSRKDGDEKVESDGGEEV